MVQIAVVSLGFFILNKLIMVKTTSLKHFKELKAKGVNVELVCKAEINITNGKY